MRGIRPCRSAAFVLLAGASLAFSGCIAIPDQPPNTVQTMTVPMMIGPVMIGVTIEIIHLETCNEVPNS